MLVIALMEKQGIRLDDGQRIIVLRTLLVDMDDPKSRRIHLATDRLAIGTESIVARCDDGDFDPATLDKKPMGFGCTRELTGRPGSVDFYRLPSITDGEGFDLILGNDQPWKVRQAERQGFSSFSRGGTSVSLVFDIPRCVKVTRVEAHPSVIRSVVYP